MSKKKKVFLYLSGAIMLFIFYFFITGWHVSLNPILDGFAKAQLIPNSSHVYDYELDDKQTLHIFKHNENIYTFISEKFLIFHRPSIVDGGIILNQESSMIYIDDNFRQNNGFFFAYNPKASHIELKRFMDGDGGISIQSQEIYPHLFLARAMDNSYGSYVSFAYDEADRILALSSQSAIPNYAVASFTYEGTTYNIVPESIEDTPVISNPIGIKISAFPDDPVLILSNFDEHTIDQIQIQYLRDLGIRFYLREDGKYDVIKKEYLTNTKQLTYTKYIVHEFSFNALIEQLFKEIREI